MLRHLASTGGQLGIKLRSGPRSNIGRVVHRTVVGRVE
jgi:hypothetical protein